VNHHPTATAINSLSGGPPRLLSTPSHECTTATRTASASIPTELQQQNEHESQAKKRRKTTTRRRTTRKRENEALLHESERKKKRNMFVYVVLKSTVIELFTSAKNFCILCTL
jgi:hypothetical protein